MEVRACFILFSNRNKQNDRRYPPLRGWARTDAGGGRAVPESLSLSGPFAAPQALAPAHRSSRAATFDDLPPPVHLAVVLRLPLVDRVRAGLVARSWAALLRETEFWAELNFEGAQPELVTPELLLELARRARGQLRSFDVAAAEREWRRTLPLGSMELPTGWGRWWGWGIFSLPELAGRGLTARLRTLAAGRWITIRDADGARGLLRACPQLTSVSLVVSNGWPDAVGAVRLLPLSGDSRVELSLVDGADAAVGFVPFATAVAEALSACPAGRGGIGTLCFLGGDDTPRAGSVRGRGTARDFLENCTATPEAIDAAAAQLGAALACPTAGPKRLETDENFHLSSTPVAAHLWRRLTPESRLRSFRDCPGHSNSYQEVRPSAARADPAGVAALADALASGRARLERLEIDGCIMGTGCAPCACAAS